MIICILILFHQYPKVSWGFSQDGFSRRNGDIKATIWDSLVYVYVYLFSRVYKTIWSKTCKSEYIKYTINNLLSCIWTSSLLHKERDYSFWFFALKFAFWPLIQLFKDPGVDSCSKPENAWIRLLWTTAEAFMQMQRLGLNDLWQFICRPPKIN